MNEDIRRAIELLQVAAKTFKKYHPDTEIFYDGVESDTTCLADDMISAAKMLGKHIKKEN